MSPVHHRTDRQTDTQTHHSLTLWRKPEFVIPSNQESPMAYITFQYHVGAFGTSTVVGTKKYLEPGTKVLH